MKTFHLVVSVLVLAGSPLALLACGGDGGGGGGSSSSAGSSSDNGSITIASNGDTLETVGAGVYLDLSTGQYVYNTFGFSAASGTKDVNLEQADRQQADLQTRAQAIADKFQMSYDAAVQLTQLSDRMKGLAARGQVTPADRAAVTASALGIAGVSADEVNRAVNGSLQGDDRATDELLTKAAANLGMPSAAVLRDQLLPALGVQL